MKIFRFMSLEEFEKYKKGETLENKKIHKDKTNSIGFCFLDTKDFKVEDAMHFLSSIVSFDICAIFETKEKNLKKSYGIYAKPIKSTDNPMEDLIKILFDFNERFTATEYCTTSYNNKDFKLIKYSENIWKQWNIRENQSDLVWKKE